MREREAEEREFGARRHHVLCLGNDRKGPSLGPAGGSWPPCGLEVTGVGTLNILL